MYVRQLWKITKITFSMFSIITPLTSETWAFTLAILLISSGWSMQYCICSFNFGLDKKFNKTKLSMYLITKKTFSLIVKEKKIPKLLAQAVCRSSCSFSSTISLRKILLNSLKKCNWNLSASGFNSNHTVNCRVEGRRLIQARNEIALFHNRGCSTSCEGTGKHHACTKSTFEMNT